MHQMMDLDTLLGRFEEHVRDRRLFPEPGVAICAVSGGADSMALLDLMCRQTQEPALRVVVGHLDHGIRPDSAEVATLVARVARDRGVEVDLVRVELGDEASETHARTVRYRELRAMQRRWGATYLLTAHQLDDQLETVVQRFLKGSGAAGLAGIPEVGPAGLRRPLLPFRRRELRAYARERRLAFDDDPANLDPRHLRSWVRATLLPIVRERLGPRVESDLARLQTAAAADRTAWDQVLDVLALGCDDAGDQMAVDRSAVARLPDPLRGAILQALARRAGSALGRNRLDAVIGALTGPSGKYVELGGGWVAEVSFEALRFTKVSESARSDQALGEPPAAAQWGAGWRLRWETDRAPARLARGGFDTWVPRVGGMRWRSPSAGDRMRPLGGTGRRSVHRLLMEARIPRSERIGHPMLVLGSDPIWVPGVCRSEVGVPAPGSPAVRIVAERVENREEP